MNYKSYLQAILPDYIVTDELNYQYNGEGTALVIKYLQGNIYKTNVYQPVQILVFTNDIEATKEELETFTRTYNNSPFLDGSDYINQFYTTAMLLSSFEQSGNNYVHQFAIQGTLVISENVSDIKQVFIDGIEYETTSRALVYASVLNNVRNGNDYLNDSKVSHASVRFTCIMVHKNQTLMLKLRTLREGTVTPNSNFTIKLVFSDGHEENYTMKLENYSMNSDNQALPLVTLAFMK